MKTQKSFYEQNGGTYTRVGDVLLSNLVIGETEKKPIGKYGRMRKRYLKEQHPVLYSELLLSGKMYSHLQEIDEACVSWKGYSNEQKNMDSASLLCNAASGSVRNFDRGSG